MDKFLAFFVINTSHVTERIKEEFPNLEDSSIEYVTTGVVGTMFFSNGKPYTRLRIEDFVDCDIRE